MVHSNTFGSLKRKLKKKNEKLPILLRTLSDRPQTSLVTHRRYSIKLRSLLIFEK